MLSNLWEFLISHICSLFLWGWTKSLGTAATSGLSYKPQMIDEGDCGAIGGMKIGRGNRSTRRKPAPAPLCPPKIPHDQTRARNRAAAVGSQRLTAWAMARPFPSFLRDQSFSCVNLFVTLGRRWKWKVPDCNRSQSSVGRNQGRMSRWARPLCSFSDWKGPLLKRLISEIETHIIFSFLQSVGRRKWCSVSCCFSVWNVRAWVNLLIFMITGIDESDWTEIVQCMFSVSRVMWFHKWVWK
jgi:hypothetical protein